MDLLTWLANVKELWIALGGAIVGGLFTMWATLVTQKGESKRTDKVRREDQAKLDNERQLVLANTATLILVEITTAWNVYRDEYADELKQLPDGAPYFCIFPIGDNSFPVFDSVPACLAQLPTEISQQIVRFYMRAKGLVSMINMNNIDTERAREYANAQLQKHHGETAAVSMSETEKADEISTRYDQDATRMALLIGMDTTAEGLKGLTSEIEALVLDIQARLAPVITA